MGADACAEAVPIVESDTISATYAHLVAMNLSSLIPHTWLHSFGIAAGNGVLSLPHPDRSFHIGLVLARETRSPWSPEHSSRPFKRSTCAGNSTTHYVTIAPRR